MVKNSKQMINFTFIDNGSTDHTLDFLKTVKNSTIIRNKQNIYVNPAWNQGLKHVIDIKYPYVCIANNDIEVGSNWIAPVLEAFKNDNFFYLPASNHDSYNNYEDFLAFKSTGIAKPKKLLPGSCVFLTLKQASLVYPIPEIMKVICGDDYIFSTLYHYGYFMRLVLESRIFHHKAVTSKYIPLEIRKKDYEEWIKIAKNKGIVPISNIFKTMML